MTLIAAVRNPSSSRPRVRESLLRALGWLLACEARLAQRRALADLDERLLRDIGLSRLDVVRETGKASWRP
jgi:uncharacterized protein YjiS (DUF1127 family)